jgi:hypothetical protein
MFQTSELLTRRELMVYKVLQSIEQGRHSIDRATALRVRTIFHFKARREIAATQGEIVHDVDYYIPLVLYPRIPL